MSEEKEAMEIINDSYDYNTGYVECEVKVWNIVVNYIDKLQKDNYKLDRENQHFFDRIQDLQKENEELHKQVDIEFVEENYIEKSKVVSKNKIRTKIKELEENVKEFEEYWEKDPRKFKKEVCVDYYKLEVLKELLGE